MFSGLGIELLAHSQAGECRTGGRSPLPGVAIAGEIHRTWREKAMVDDYILFVVGLIIAVLCATLAVGITTRFED